MRYRFSTLDIMAILPELRAKICTGWRVNQVFDCDYKTYIFKLNKSIVQMKKDNDPLSINEETENKMSFIIESGLRIHSSDYDWPKQPAPGQFATKLRKHLRNKRVEDITQVGIDRVIDIRFGSQQLANHLLIEMYDRGNLILTDHEYVIIAILRWRKPTHNEKSEKGSANDKKKAVIDEVPEETDGFKVGQTYPIAKCRKLEDLEVLTEEKIINLLESCASLETNRGPFKKRNQKAKSNVDDEAMREINLKDLLNPIVVYGSSLLEDKLLKHLALKDSKPITKAIIKIPMNDNNQLDATLVKEYAKIIKQALDEADICLKEVQDRTQSPGYIVQKKQVTDSAVYNVSKCDKTKDSDKNKTILTTNIDFFPILSCAQRKVQQEVNQQLVIEEFESFDKAVDVYFTNLESQKLDSKTFGAEKEARKKLENLKIAQERKLIDLANAQKEDEVKARLIELNSDNVENALLIMRSMIANQMSWTDIRETIKEAQEMNDPIASLIVGVKFDRNEFSMRLKDPYDENESEEDELVMVDQSDAKNKKNKRDKKNNNKKNANTLASSRYRIVDIDIGLSAHANARRFFDRRRNAVDKERKTIEVSKKAYKNVERRTKEMLKQVVVNTGISKSRKRYWFENFVWFISSEGYLVVAGRDSEQNDLLVKRYMKNNDIYVHADLHGASTVIIKNELTTPVPPKTLTEAGTFAVCNSSAWDAKIVAASWWVYPNQVSKTAPTGEYLGTGGFIIRGKKNFLPIANLVLGFGFLFRLDEDSIDRRRQARLAREAQMQSNPVEQKQEPVATDHHHDNDDVDEDDDRKIEANQEDDQSKVDNTKKQEVDESDDGSSSEKFENQPIDYDDVDEDEDVDRPSEHRLIDTITEFPEPDDILLYAIPMCGPYAAFQSFKFKVKVIPGTNKRGKAAKTSLGMFLHDKRASQREKDLLKALKDQDYARNVPNKVKISAPNMNSIVKRKPKKSEVRLPILR